MIVASSFLLWQSVKFYCKLVSAEDSQILRHGIYNKNSLIKWILSTMGASTCIVETLVQFLVWLKSLKTAQHSTFIHFCFWWINHNIGMYMRAIIYQIMQWTFACASSVSYYFLWFGFLWDLSGDTFKNWQVLPDWELNPACQL